LESAARLRIIAPRRAVHPIIIFVAPWRFTPEYAIDAKGRRSLDASFKRMNENNMLERIFAIAPMMEWTDRGEKQSVTST
jgi:hypothetical protein